MGYTVYTYSNHITANPMNTLTLLPEISQPVAGTPLFNDLVSAGFPSPAQDLIDSTLDLNTFVVKHPAATYFVRVVGESMINAGILCGDYLAVDRSLSVRDGSIVVAALHGDFTVKEFCSGKPPILVAHNPIFPSIPVCEDTTFFGVVIAVIRKIPCCSR